MYEETPNPAFDVKPKKKKLKIILLVVIALILISSSLAVLGYYTFLPAKTVLKVAAYNSINKDFNVLNDYFQELGVKNRNALFENSIQKNMLFRFSCSRALLEQLSPEPEIAELIQKAFKNTSFTYEAGFDFKNKKQAATLRVNYMDEPFFSGSIFLNNTDFAISIPELTKKTIAGNFQKLDKLGQVFPAILNETLEIYKNFDPWEQVEIKIESENIRKFMNDYSKEIINQIDADKMSIKRNQTTRVFDQDIKCQEITITLDSKELKKLVLNLLNKLKEDNNFYNIYKEMSDNIELLLKNGQISYLNFNAPKNNDYEKMIQDLIDLVEDFEFQHDLEAKLYIDGLDIVKYIFRFYEKETKETSLIYISENIHKAKSFNTKITFSDSEDSNKSLIVHMSGINPAILLIIK